MLELFLTSLVIFVLLTGFICFFTNFKVINFFLYIFQLILAITLLSIKLYKKHVLLIGDLITHVHNKTFSAITYLEPKYENGVFKYLTVNYENNNSYSIMKDSEYSNECLYNYFISYSTCPI